jgi:hypothetical protein
MFESRRSGRDLVVILAMLLVSLAGAAAAGAVAALGATGSAPIYRSSGHTCAGGATQTVDQVGQFTATRSGRAVYGTVEVEGVAPNANFSVSIFENHRCLRHSVGTLHTDEDGDGLTAYKIDVTSTATVVWVYLLRSTHTLVSTTIPIG